MELCRVTQNHVELYRVVYSYTESCRGVWSCVELCRVAQNRVELYRVVESYTEPCRGV